MQNEELRRAQAELEVSRGCYLDLYELAPVGYLSLNEAGRIIEAKPHRGFACSASTRSLSVQEAVSAHTSSPSDADLFHKFRGAGCRRRCRAYSCELRIKRRDGELRLGAARSDEGPERRPGAPVLRVVISDINPSAWTPKARLRARGREALRVSAVPAANALEQRERDLRTIAEPSHPSSTWSCRSSRLETRTPPATSDASPNSRRRSRWTWRMSTARDR